MDVEVISGVRSSRLFGVSTRGRLGVLLLFIYRRQKVLLHNTLKQYVVTFVLSTHEMYINKENKNKKK